MLKVDKIYHYLYNFKLAKHANFEMYYELLNLYKKTTTSQM